MVATTERGARRGGFIVLVVTCWLILFVGFEGVRPALLVLTVATGTLAWVLETGRRRRMAAARERSLRTAGGPPRPCVTVRRFGAQIGTVGQQGR